MLITKKVWKPYFQAIMDGKKTFDARLVDFECKEGDTLELVEVAPTDQRPTGRRVIKKVTYVMRSDQQPFWTAEQIRAQGLQIIGFRQEDDKLTKADDVIRAMYKLHVDSRIIRLGLEGANEVCTCDACMLYTEYLGDTASPDYKKAYEEWINKQSKEG